MNKDLLNTYRNYLYCLQWVQEFDNKYGDEDVLPIFQEKLEQSKILKKTKNQTKFIKAE